MEVFFLGTGAGVPAKKRNVSAIALKLLAEQGTIWLFDCGEGTQHQILRTSLKPGKIDKIFITHLHGDHIYGLPGFLASRSFQGGESKVTIYGPEGIEKFVRMSLSVSKTVLKYPLEIVEINEGRIFENDRFIVEAKLLEHGISSFGYRIVEKDYPGSLLVEKLKQDGVPPGPVYKRIKNGETVTLEDGRVIDGRQYIGPPQKGRVVAVLGDTRVCKNSVLLARDADLLIHEATFSHGAEELAYDYYHSTTVQAAGIAAKANVKRLCITHISSRYDRDAWDMLVKEARRVFPETIMAEDFKEVSVPLAKRE